MTREKSMDDTRRRPCEAFLSVGTHRSWFHEDGTPIEPPNAATDSKSKAPEPKPVVPPEASYCRECVSEDRSDMVCRKHLKDASAKLRELECKASELADVRNVLRSRERTITEMDHELQWLKRELKRTDPRLYRARYERGGGR